jgi:DNA-directed RNA polymerase specialized sigma24 family protein
MERTINPEVRQELDEADWDDIFPRLLWYAKLKSYKIRWIGNAAADPEELVGEAIALTYGAGKNDGYREWNKEKFPNLLDFLQTIINSLISHLNEHHNKFPNDELDDQLSSENPDPEKLVLQKDYQEKLYNRIYQEVEGDDEMETVILSYEEEITTPRDIATRTGLDVTQVNNTLKRLRRKLRPVAQSIISREGTLK